MKPQLSAKEVFPEISSTASFMATRRLWDTLPNWDTGNWDEVYDTIPIPTLGIGKQHIEMSVSVTNPMIGSKKVIIEILSTS